MSELRSNEHKQQSACALRVREREREKEEEHAVVCVSACVWPTK